MTLRTVVRVPSGAPDSAELPLVILLHGRGADANDLADLAPLIDDEFRFVFPNAPKAFEAAPGMTFGFTWFDGLPPDPRSIAESRRLVLELIDGLLDRFPTPSGKIILGGFSQGGMMALDVGFRTKQQLAGLVVMSGALYEQELPPLRSDLPVVITHGTADEMINVNMARRARRVLEQHHVPVEYHEFPMGHQISQESLAVVSEFIRSSLEHRL